MYGTLVRQSYPHLMDVIGASLEETHELTLHYEVIKNKGKISVLEGTGLFMLDLKCRILIPHDRFTYLQRLKNPDR